MSLLVIEGFEALSVAADFQKKYRASSNVNLTTSNLGRRGGRAMSTSSFGSDLEIDLGGSKAGVIIGFAYKINSTGASTSRIIECLAGSSTQCMLTHAGTRGLSIVRGTGTILASTGDFVMPLSEYCYIEFKAIIHNTAGSIEVRVNGAPVLTFAGDTAETASNSADRVDVSNVSSQYLIDDLYICDTTGSTNNDFLGDVRVDTLMPNADGTYRQFTPSAGTDHYALIDEVAPSTSDYVTGVTVGHRDSYAMENLGAVTGADIFGLSVHGVFSKDDNGNKTATIMLRTNGANYDGPVLPMAVTPRCLGKLYEKNPDGNVAWTEATVNALEVGAVVAM